MRAQPGFLPTQREIARHCRLIRKRWSPAEHRRRLVGCGLETVNSVWQPPQIDTSFCTARVRRVAIDHSA